jgi:c(7)-type cytochrome triheme protein
MRKFFIGALVFMIIISAAGIFSLFSFVNPSENQPIEFIHKKHKEQGIDCETCHIYIKKESFAGIPNLQTCLDCHESPVTKSSEEEKIRSFAKKGMKLEWKRLYRMPQHVYFSHRRHVALAKLECQNCHGSIEDAPKPPLKPLKILMMNDCIDCHKKSRAVKVSTDCIDCHK